MLNTWDRLLNTFHQDNTSISILTTAGNYSRGTISWWTDQYIVLDETLYVLRNHIVEISIQKPLGGGVELKEK